MTRIYLAEKNDQARSLARAIPGIRTVAAQGHLLELAPPHLYDPALKKWSIDPLPFIPASWKRSPIREKGKGAKLKAAVTALRNASEIVIATDPGSEGELIARSIIAHARVPRSTRILRLWSQSLTRDALQNANANLKPGTETEPLWHAAELRSRTDWLEGINFSRLVSLQCIPFGVRGYVLSVGRVQSPTLALIVDRQHQIDNFAPETYFTITATATAARDRTLSVSLRHAPQKPRLTDRQEAAARTAVANNWTGPISASTERKRRAPPRLHDLSSLQSLASRTRKWTSSKTLSVAQSLYEAALITYPRTDCQYIGPTELPLCQQVLAALDRRKPYDALASLRPSPLLQRKTTFNAAAVEKTDHHAIIPTHEAPPANLDPDSAWLLEAVTRRFLAQFLPDWSYDLTILSATPDLPHTPPPGAPMPFRLQARGTTTIDSGWKAAEMASDAPARRNTDTPRDDSELGELPRFQYGERVALSGAAMQTAQTKPPPRYSDGTIIPQMKKMRLGTKSTWNAAIDTLVRRQYVTRSSNQLVPTELGVSLVGMLRQRIPAIVDPERTASLEEALEKVTSSSPRQSSAEAAAIQRQVEQALTSQVATLKATPLPKLPFPQPDQNSTTPQTRKPATARRSTRTRRKGQSK